MYLPDTAAAAPPAATLLPSDHPCFGCPVRDHAVCNVLGHADLAAFKRSGNTRHLGSGEALCWEGATAGHVYNVTQGVLRLSKLLPDGRRQITGFAFPGDFLGITMDDEHPFTVEAVAPTELCRFSRARFDAFVEEHPHMERRLYTAAARELSAAREQLVLLGRKTAAERLATFIVEMVGHTPQIEGQAPRALLPMSRSDIADYLGLRIETVSRELGALKAARLVRMMGIHELLILDLASLESLAAG